MYIELLYCTCVTLSVLRTYIHTCVSNCAFRFAGKSVAKTATARQPARPTKNASAGSSSSGKVGGGGGGAKAKKRPPWDLKGRVQVQSASCA